ncbi:MAG: tetratricopeptide repeat protein [Thermoguttaceae bacterium]|jgi:tetratricopeptide (TPR) repeat protein
MKTVINLRFLGGLLLVTAVLGGAVHALHVVQVRRHATFLLDRAHRAIEEKQFPAAIKGFQQYLALVPKDADTQAELGLLLADLHQPRPALVTLEQALRNQPDRDDVRRRLVQLDMDLRRWGDAREHLQQYLLVTSPEDPALWELLGTCQAAGAEYAAAVESFRKALRFAPQQLDAYWRLADVLRRNLDRHKEADQWMEKLVAANPDSARAHLLRGVYLEKLYLEKYGQENRSPDKAESEGAKKKAEEAKRDLAVALGEAEKALHLAPKDIDALLLAARLASLAAQYDKARGYVQQVLAVDPTRAAGYATLWRIELRTEHRKEAIACLRQGVGKASQNWQLLWDLGRLLIDESERAQTQKEDPQADAQKELARAEAQKKELLAEARQVVAKLRKADPSDPLTDYLEAQIEFALGHWPKAAQGFEQAAQKLGSAPDLAKEAYVRLAGCNQRLGKAELELAAYRKAARLDPLYLPARLGLAAALASFGQTNDALEEYRQISDLEGLPAAVKRKVEIEVARFLIVKNLRLPASDRSWKEVETLLDRLVQDKAEPIDVTLLRAETLIGQARGPEAEKLLLAARSRLPDEPRLWSALVLLIPQGEQWERAVQIMDEAKQKFGDRVWLRIARGQYLVKRYGKESAPKLKELADGSQAFSAGDRLRLCGVLAVLAREAGDQELSARFCRLACEADPKNLDARLLLCELTSQSGDVAATEQVLKEIRAIEGDGPEWHYAQAVQLATLLGKAEKAKKREEEEKGLYQQALGHLAAAGKLRPAWARIPLLAASLYDGRGQIDPALENYRKAIELGEQNPLAVRRTFELLCRRQRYAEANQMIPLLELGQALSLSEIGRLASEVSARLNQMDRALQIARQAAAQSKEWRDHLWLGQLLGFLGRRAQAAQRPDEAQARWTEAEKSLRQAVELAPQAPETWVGLIQLLAATDQKPEAERMIQQARDKIPAEQAPLALGPCYEALGDVDQAAKQYEAAKTAKDPVVVRRLAEFCLQADKPEMAETHLRRIAKGEVSAKPEDVAWARRALAAVLQARGGYQNVLQAIALVDENLAAAATPEDQAQKAILLALRPRRPERREAIRALQNVLQSQPSGAGQERLQLAEVRFALARLYLAENDWPQANRQMLALLLSHGKQSRYMAAYVAMLLERKEIHEAELWLGRLEENAPDDFATASLKAEASVRRGQIDEAIQTLRTYLEKPTAKPPERDARVRLAAACLELISRQTSGADQKASAAKLCAEAEALYRDYAKQHADQELLVASCLARRGQLDEAITLAEGAWQKAPPAAIAGAARDLLAAGPATPAQTERLEKLLLAALEKHHRPVSLLLVLGDLRMHQERSQDATAIYREIITADKDNAIALNNLAMLLAFQKKEVEQSLQLIQRAIEVAGPLPALLDTRASVFLALGQPEKAVADLEEVLRDEPKPDRQFHLALAYWRLKQDNAAAEAFAAAQKLGLKPEQLDPLEREDYRALAKKLGRAN